MPVGKVVPYPAENRHERSQNTEEHSSEDIGSREKKEEASVTEGGASATEEEATRVGARQGEGTGGGVDCGHPQCSHTCLQGLPWHRAQFDFACRNLFRKWV